MLWVLDRTVSLRWLFLAPKSHVATDGKDINFMFIFVVVYLGLSQYLCWKVNLYEMLLLNCKSELLLFLLLLIVTPILKWSMFCCVLLCVHSSFAIISGCFALFVLLVYYCCVAFPHDEIGLSAVWDCGFSWSYSLPIFGETANWLPHSYCL